MGALHQEVSFEDEVCTVLAANGWLHQLGDAQAYDRARALFPADLIAWVEETQPKAWEALQKAYPAAPEAALLDRVRKSLDDRLRVVRQVRYSTANENCIDLVLFLNGLPVATVELKTGFTQSVGDAARAVIYFTEQPACVTIRTDRPALRSRSLGR